MKTKLIKENFLPVQAGLTALLVLAAAGPWLPATWLWGSNHSAWLPVWVRLVFPAAGLLVVWSRAGTYAGRAFTAVLGRRVLNRPPVAFGLVPALGAAVFWLMRDPTNMLGDGQTLAVMIAGDNLYHGFDFMTYHLLARIYQWSGGGGEAAAIRVAAVMSCVSGAGYLAAAAWSARRLAADEAGKVLLYVLLVFGAGLQVFFGYMEVYAPLAVLLLVFLTLLILYLEGRGSLQAAAAAWGAALFFHLNALFLAPLLVAALWMRPAADTSPVPRRVLTVIWPPAVALAAGAVIFALAGYDPARMRADFGHVGTGSGILVSLTGADGLLTWRHLKDTLNLILLLAPVPVVLLLTGRRKTGPARGLLAAGSLWLAVLLLLVHLKLGSVRDWDLFAPHAALLTLAGWYSLAGRAGAVPIPSSLTGMLAGVAVVLTVPWFALNAGETPSLARLEAVAADLAPYPRGLLHEQFAYHHRLAGNPQETMRHFRKCGEVCPNHPRFHAIYGTFMLNQGNAREAADAYDRAVAADSTYAYGLKMATLARVMNREYEAALDPARRLADLGGQDAEAAAAHGLAAQETGHPAEAAAAYHRAAALDSSRIDLLERAAGLQLVHGDYRRAEEDFRKVLKADSRRASARLGLADAIWQDHLAHPGSRTAGETGARLDEVAGLIDRAISADASQGKDTRSLAAWRRQVAAEREAVTER